MSLGANIERPKRFLDADFFPSKTSSSFLCLFFFGKDVYGCLNVLNEKKSTNLTPVFWDHMLHTW